MENKSVRVCDECFKGGFNRYEEKPIGSILVPDALACWNCGKTKISRSHLMIIPGSLKPGDI